MKAIVISKLIPFSEDQSMPWTIEAESNYLINGWTESDVIEAIEAYNKDNKLWRAELVEFDCNTQYGSYIQCLLHEKKRYRFHIESAISLFKESLDNVGVSVLELEEKLLNRKIQSKPNEKI